MSNKDLFTPGSFHEGIFDVLKYIETLPSCGRWYLGSHRPGRFKIARNLEPEAPAMLRLIFDNHDDIYVTPLIIPDKLVRKLVENQAYDYDLVVSDNYWWAGKLRSWFLHLVKLAGGLPDDGSLVTLEKDGVEYDVILKENPTETSTSHGWRLIIINIPSGGELILAV